MDLTALPGVADLVKAALAEDIGQGDLTTRLVVPEDAEAEAGIVARQDAVLAGLPLIGTVFELAGGGVQVELKCAEGDAVRAETAVCRLVGPATVLLAGERVALNFLQHLSGIATMTRRFVQTVAGTRARIADTRKTLPGLRALQKYAVRVGGGVNHRGGLDRGILIKNNHIAVAGGLGAAVRRARAGVPHWLRVEVECSSLEQVDEALAAGADAILLDNMAPADLATAVQRIGGRALVEASGGIGLDGVRAVAEAGVDIISIGALTHSAPAADLHMRLQPRARR